MSQPVDNTLKRLLEEATASADTKLAGDRDPDTAALHETWLAFGRMLDVANPAEDVPRFEIPQTRPRQHRRGWVTAVLVAAAASLLMAIGVSWAVRTTVQFLDTPVARQPSPLPPTVAVDRGEANRAATQEVAAIAVTAKWDDSFDEQKTLFEEQLVAARQDQASGSLAVSVLQCEVQQMLQDLGGKQLY